MELIQMNKYCNDFHNGNDIIFCKIDNVLSEFESIRGCKKNVAMIISSGDITFTDTMLKYCPDNVKIIFSTNTTCDSSIVIPIPTGVENEQNPIRDGHGCVNNEIFDKLPYLINNDLDKIKFTDRIYSNFSLNEPGSHLHNMYRGYRLKVKTYCDDIDYIDYETGINLNEYMNKVSLYPGLISPIGNGIECIRTWETMYMNRVPIVIGDVNLHNVIYDNIYRHLPLLFINNLNILENKEYIMEETYKCFEKSKEKLDYNYWKQFIYDHIKKIKL